MDQLPLHRANEIGDRALIVYSKDPLGHYSGMEFYPGEIDPYKECTVTEHLEALNIMKDFKDQPLWCTFNGHPILRERYDTIVMSEGDILIVHNQLWGGGGDGGSDWKRTVLMVGLVVLSIYAPYAAGILGQGGFAATAIAAGGSGVGWAIGAAAMSSAVMMAGGYLIDMIAPISFAEPDPGAAPSPTYSLAAQGNQARLGQTVPVRYGAHRVYPDFAAQPYPEQSHEAIDATEASATATSIYDPAYWEAYGYPPEAAKVWAEAYAKLNPQAASGGTTSGDSNLINGDATYRYMNMLYCVGEGEYDVTGMKIGDTPVDEIDDANITYEVYQPGEPVTLFPVAVKPSQDISGQALDDADQDSVGYYVLGASTDIINRFTVDLAFPAGIFAAWDSGSYHPSGAWILIEWIEVDQSGITVPGGVTGSYEWKIWSFQFEPAFVSRTIVPSKEARYKVKYSRVTPSGANPDPGYSASTWNVTNCVITSVKAYLSVSSGQTNTFPGRTMLAVRMKIGEELSNTANRRINVLISRKLYQWNGSYAGTATGTRNLGQAIIDMCHDADFGIDMEDVVIDLPGIKALGDQAEAEGVHFDYSYDRQLGAWDALKLAAAIYSSEPVIQNGVLRVLRDERQLTEVASYDAENIVPGSFSTQWLIPNSKTADSINVGYYDNAINGTYQEVMCIPAGSSGLNPVDIKCPGLTDRDNVHEWGCRKARANQLRRTLIMFETTFEGYLPTKFQNISTNLPQIDQFMASGSVLDVSGDTFTVSSSEIPSGSNYYAAIRDRSTGALGDAYAVVRVADNKIRFTGFVPVATPMSALKGDEEPSHFVLGLQSFHERIVKVDSVIPLSESTVKIVGFVDNTTVYDGLPPDTPVINPYLLEKFNGQPTIGIVTSTFTGTLAMPGIKLVWVPVDWTTSYTIHTSDDNADWRYLASVGVAQYDGLLPVDESEYPQYFRVRAVGAVPGPWSDTVTVNYDQLVFSNPRDIKNLRIYDDATALETEFYGTSAKVQWDAAGPQVWIDVDVAFDTGGGFATKRTDTLVPMTTTYAYSYIDAIKDDPFLYYGIKFIKDGARNLKFTLTGKGPDGQLSTNPVSRTFSNIQYGQLDTGGIDWYETDQTLKIQYTKPEDDDFLGMRVHLSEINGFTPSDGDTVYSGAESVVVLTATLDPNKTYYMRIGFYDVWGVDGITYASQETINTGDKVLSGTIDYDDIGGTKPDPNATVNRFTTSATAPVAPEGYDVWYDTVNKLLKIWDGDSWEVGSNHYTNTLELLDGAKLGENTVSYSTIAPSNPDLNALWFDTNDATAPLYLWVGGVWELLATANKVTYASAAPGSPATGEQWLDTDTGVLSYWTGTTWEMMSTSVKSGRGTSLPSVDNNTGDIYFLTTNGRYYYWDGNSWEVAADRTADQPQDYDWIVGDKPDVNATVNKFTTSATAPASPAGFDIWYDTTNKLLKIWDGNSWETGSNNYTNTLELLDGAALGENKITYSTTAPGSPSDGELWFDTNDASAPLMVYNSGSWKLIGTVNKVTYQSTQPTGTANNELWVDTDDGVMRRWLQATNYWEVVSTSVRSFSGSTAPTDPPFDLNTGDLFFNSSTGKYYFYNGSSWILTADSTESNPQDYDWITGGKPDINATVNKYYRQNTTPSSSSDGDLWYDIDDDRLYAKIGGSWYEIGNTFDNSSQLTDGADWGKNNLTYSTTAPGSPQTGDLWFDTNDPRQPLSTWTGSGWELVGTVNSIVYQSSAPSNPNIGDEWLDTDNGSLTYWDGSNWKRKSTTLRSFRQSAMPTDGINSGDQWFDTDTGIFYWYDGSTWQVTTDSTLDRFGGDGVNRIQPQHQIFANEGFFENTARSGVVVYPEENQGYYGEACLKIDRNGVTDAYVYMGRSTTDYNINLEPNQQWIFSMKVSASSSGYSGKVNLKLSDGSWATSKSWDVSSAGSWYTITHTFDLRSKSARQAILYFEITDEWNAKMRIDGVKLEKKIGNLTNATPWDQFSGSIGAGNIVEDAIVGLWATWRTSNLILAPGVWTTVCTLSGVDHADGSTMHFDGNVHFLPHSSETYTAAVRWYITGTPDATEANWQTIPANIYGLPKSIHHSSVAANTSAAEGITWQLQAYNGGTTNRSVLYEANLTNATIREYRR